MPNTTETEVKLYIPHLEHVQAQLESLAAKLTAPRIYESNIRFENVEQTLTRADIVLRLRQDTRTRLTYKDSTSVQDGIVTRTELEVEVSDFATMQTILEKLGYHPHMNYEKYRTTYELDGAEIVLDEMPYGNFVEIEGEATVIENLITRLGLQDAMRCDGSYSDLFERVKQHLGLTFVDLSFDNFKGMDVPESAFQATDH
jgi:adenylate cyclase, class 2